MEPTILERLEQTIRDCQAGNALAWELLIKQFQGKVYSVAYYLLRNRAEAEDATQETFIKVYRRLQEFRSDGQGFAPWLLAIARNCCIDRMRRSGTRRKYEDGMAREAEVLGEADKGPDTVLAEQEQQDLLFRALDRFDADSRDVLLLKDVQGLKTEEVAEILDMPVGTVKSRSSRARLKLAKLFTEFGTLFNGQSESST